MFFTIFSNFLLHDYNLCFTDSPCFTITTITILYDLTIHSKTCSPGLPNKPTKSSLIMNYVFISGTNV